MNKKLCTLISAIALSTVTIIGTADFGDAFVGINADKVYYINLTNNDELSFVGNEATLEYAPHVILEYTNAEEDSDGLNHVILNKGGTIRKIEVSKGLKTINVEFNGSLKLNTGFGLSDLRFEYSLTSNLATPIKGNYFVLTAEETTSIKSIRIDYDCYTESSGEHNMDTNWTSDEVNHWHKCLEDEHCTYRTNVAAHTFVGDAFTGKVTCSTCGYETLAFIPDDDSVDLKEYKLEGENAVVNFDEVTSYTDWRNTFSEVNNIAFSFDFSNKLCTRNMLYKDSKLEYTFTSDKAVRANMSIVVSTHDDKKYPYDLSKQFVIYSQGVVAGETQTYCYKFNNQSYTVQSINDTTSKLYKTIDGVNADPQYFRFVTHDFKLPIFEGQNKIWVQFLSGGSGANVDVIKINTTANLTGLDEISKHYTDNDSTWEVTKNPTLSAPGIITVSKFIDGQPRTYSYELASIMFNGEIRDGYYLKRETDTERIYAFTVKGKEFEIPAPKELALVNVSIKEGSKLRFSDGSTEKIFTQGESITQSTFSVDSNYTLKGFNVYDAGGNQLTAARTLTYPVETESLIVGDEVCSYNGFTLLQPGNEQKGCIPQSNASSFTGHMSAANFSVVTGNTTVVNGGVDGLPEYGNKFTYNGALNKGDYCRINTVVDTKNAVVTKNKNHTFHYNIENMGDETISATIYQVNSVVTIETGDTGRSFTLEPHESITFTFTMKFAKGDNNKNALTLLKLNSAVTKGWSLGISFSIDL